MIIISLILIIIMTTVTVIIIIMIGSRITLGRGRGEASEVWRRRGAGAATNITNIIAIIIINVEEYDKN